jgi:hypothetical protein
MEMASSRRSGQRISNKMISMAGMEWGVCNRGWGGRNCMEKTCTNSCSGHGTCNANLTCICANGWSGEACDLRVCPHDCSGNGHCFNGPSFPSQ